jgi:hypothetical protein
MCSQALDGIESSVGYASCLKILKVDDGYHCYVPAYRAFLIPFFEMGWVHHSGYAFNRLFLSLFFLVRSSNRVSFVATLTLVTRLLASPGVLCLRIAFYSARKAP